MADASHFNLSYFEAVLQRTFNGSVPPNVAVLSLDDNNNNGSVTMVFSFTGTESDLYARQMVAATENGFQAAAFTDAMAEAGLNVTSVQRASPDDEPHSAAADRTDHTHYEIWGLGAAVAVLVLVVAALVTRNRRLQNRAAQYDTAENGLPQFAVPIIAAKEVPTGAVSYPRVKALEDVQAQELAACLRSHVTHGSVNGDGDGDATAAYSLLASDACPADLRDAHNSLSPAGQQAVARMLLAPAKTNPLAVDAKYV